MFRTHLADTNIHGEYLGNSFYYAALVEEVSDFEQDIYSSVRPPKSRGNKIKEKLPDCKNKESIGITFFFFVTSTFFSFFVSYNFNSFMYR